MLKKVRRYMMWQNALAKYKASNYAEARRVLDRYMREYPPSWEVSVMYANTLVMIGSREEAVEQYKQAIETAARQNGPEREWVSMYCDHMLARLEGNDPVATAIEQQLERMVEPKAVRHFIRFSDDTASNL